MGYNSLQNKMKREFKIIAAGLGIILPASLSGLSEANAAPCKLDGNKIVFTNEVSKRMINFMPTNIDESFDNTMLAHTDYHADQQPDHTDQHSNREHSDRHTNRQQKDMCPSHSDSHANTNAYSSHTNYGRTVHSNNHTNHAWDNC